MLYSEKAPKELTISVKNVGGYFFFFMLIFLLLLFTEFLSSWKCCCGNHWRDIQQKAVPIQCNQFNND